MIVRLNFQHIGGGNMGSTRRPRIGDTVSLVDDGPQEKRKVIGLVRGGRWNQVTAIIVTDMNGLVPLSRVLKINGAEVSYRRH